MFLSHDQFNHEWEHSVPKGTLVSYERTLASITLPDGQTLSAEGMFGKDVYRGPRAVCSCGWVSMTYAKRESAEAMGDDHLSTVGADR